MIMSFGRCEVLPLTSISSKPANLVGRHYQNHPPRHHYQEDHQLPEVDKTSKTSIALFVVLRRVFFYVFSHVKFFFAQQHSLLCSSLSIRLPCFLFPILPRRFVFYETTVSFYFIYKSKHNHGINVPLLVLLAECACQ